MAQCSIKRGFGVQVSSPLLTSPLLRYLDKEKVVAGDKHSFTFRWGHRSKQEINQEVMLEFVADIYGGDILQWKRQFGPTLGISGSEDAAED